MKATLKVLEFTSQGVHVVVEFSPSTGESFTSFTRETWADAASATVIKLQTWVTDLLNEFHDQYNIAQNNQNLIGYTIEV